MEMQLPSSTATLEPSPAADSQGDFSKEGGCNEETPARKRPCLGVGGRMMEDQFMECGRLGLLERVTFSQACTKPLCVNMEARVRLESHEQAVLSLHSGAENRDQNLPGPASSKGLPVIDRVKEGDTTASTISPRTEGRVEPTVAPTPITPAPLGGDGARRLPAT